MRYERTLLILLLLAVAIPRAAFVLRSDEGVVAAPIVDDGFYNMTVARNIAAGLGCTFDGVDTTTGFHPLVILIAAPVFWLTGGGTTTPLRIILAVYLLASVALAWLLYRVVRRLGGPRTALAALVLFATSPIAGIYLNTMNGCDTVFGGILLLATTWYYLARVRPNPDAPTKRYVALGLLAGSLGLARLDLGFYAAALGVELLLRRRAFPKLAAYAVAGMLAVSPWIAFNVMMTGRPLPDNGRAVTLISRATAALEMQLAEPGLIESLSRGIPALSDDANPYPNDDPPPGFRGAMTKHAALSLLNETPVTSLPLAWSAAFAPGASAFRRDGWPYYASIALTLALALCLVARRRVVRESGALDGLGWLVAGSVLVFFAYPLVVFGQWFFGRYYFPPVLVTLLLTPAIAAAISRGARWGAWRTTCAVALFVVPFACSSVPALLEPMARPFYSQARALADRLPKTAVIGAIQAGHLGFFCPQRVVNLDGKVSSAAHRALAERRVLAFAREAGVNVVTEWPSLISLMVVKRSSPALAARLQRVDPPPGGPPMNAYGWATYLFRP